MPTKDKPSFWERLFQVDPTKIDYRSLNVWIRIIGALLALTLIIFITQTITDTLFRPLLNVISLLSPFIFGVVFSWLLTPIVTKLVDNGWSRTLASTLVTFGAVAFLLALFGGLFYVTATSFVNFFTGGYEISHFLDTGDSLIEYINQNFNNEAVTTGLLRLFIQVGEFFGVITSRGGRYEIIIDTTGQLPSFLGNVGGYAWQVLISIIVVAFLLPNFGRFHFRLRRFAPKRYATQWANFVDIVAHSFSQYMRGALLIATIVGSTVMIGTLLISLLTSTVLYFEGTSSILNYQANGIFVIMAIFVFGVVVMATNLIPYVGPFIGGVPVVVIVALNDTTPNYWVTIAVAGVIVFVQSLESLFLQPYVMGKQTKLHPVTILLGLAVFGAMFGVIGLLISTPIISIGRSVIRYWQDGKVTT
jgi:predicted PurR-regulated permease PerM